VSFILADVDVKSYTAQTCLKFVINALWWCLRFCRVICVVYLRYFILQNRYFVADVMQMSSSRRDTKL